MIVRFILLLQIVLCLALPAMGQAGILLGGYVEGVIVSYNGRIFSGNSAIYVRPAISLGYQFLPHLALMSGAGLQNVRYSVDNYFGYDEHLGYQRLRYLDTPVMFRYTRDAVIEARNNQRLGPRLYGDPGGNTATPYLELGVIAGLRQGASFEADPNFHPQYPPLVTKDNPEDFKPATMRVVFGFGGLIGRGPIKGDIGMQLSSSFSNWCTNGSLQGYQFKTSHTAFGVKAGILVLL